MKKDDCVTVTIEDMGINGEGIGKVDGFPLFIKDAIIGDVVKVKLMKVKKQYAFARLMEILEPSVDRVTPPCPVSRQCGGCQIQALSYEKQLAFKQNLVENDLKRIGGFQNVPMMPIIGMEHPFRYRNKAQFPVGTDKDGNPVAGFYAGRTHSIISCKDCMLGVCENQEILDRILTFMKREQVTAYEEETGKGVVRHVLIRKGFTSGQIMVCLVINGSRLPVSDKLVAALKDIPGMTSISISPNPNMTNVIMGEKSVTLWGSDTIEDSIGDIKYQISPLSFFQVNPVQTRKLYETALSFAKLTGKETVWDLYCGIGTISLFLAKEAKQVYGVEIIPQAIEDAKKNADVNHIDNATFFVGKAEEIFPQQMEAHPEIGKPDVIVVDPPRKGCDGILLQTMLQMKPEKIVYVSCDPATLSRDLKVLCEGDYQVEKVQAVDQFPQTVHVEVVVMLSRTEGTTRAL